jgi:hypothetical protein
MMLLVTALTFAATGCGEQDPGVIGPRGLDAGLTAEGKKQAYADSVGSALQQLGTSQGPTYGRAVEAGNKRQLQVAALAWKQGLQQLKQANPPKDAAAAHEDLVAAVSELSSWNARITAAAPNKAQTKRLAKQASTGSASQQFEAAVCQLVEAGYEIIDPGACTPLANAEGPLG